MTTSRGGRVGLGTKVKFCGLRRAPDVTHAVQLGASFLGFVFAPSSPRRLGLAEAERLLADLDTGDALRVGVFQDQPLEVVREAIQHCRLDLVQLHGRESRSFAEGLDVRVIVVVRAAADAADETPTDRPRAWPRNAYAALIDAQDRRGRSGGLGVEVDAVEFERLRAALPARTRVFMAGGLTPENVAARVARHRPYAVDVSSGVESTPGVKDAQRMQAFVAALKEPA